MPTRLQNAGEWLPSSAAYPIFKQKKVRSPVMNMHKARFCLRSLAEVVGSVHADADQSCSRPTFKQKSKEPDGRM